MDKINIYINSKNRDSNEKISNFTVRIPQNLLRLERGEHFSLNVNGFYCYNSWFNCIDGFNNEFQIIIKNINDEIVETSPALAPVHRWIGLLRRESSEPPRGLEPHSHPLTEGSKGCGACQATLLCGWRGRGRAE